MTEVLHFFVALLHRLTETFLATARQAHAQHRLEEFPERGSVLGGSLEQHQFELLARDELLHPLSKETQRARFRDEGLTRSIDRERFLLRGATTLGVRHTG